MIIYPVSRFKFELTAEETEAFEVIASIDCSDACNCEGCPLRVIINEDTTRCIKVMTKGMLKRIGVIKND